MRSLFFSVMAGLLLAVGCSVGPEDGNYTLHLYTTNDVHGKYFDTQYIGDRTQRSLMTVSAYVDSFRTEYGAENVLLVDAGDFLQGDNAAYYYNYVDTETEHIFSRMTEYMGYDAVVVGNHDVETGHPVYDRLAKTMEVPLLAANAVHEGTDKPYFQDYTIVKKNGLKVAIIGFTNANMKNWLEERIWSGIDFLSITDVAQDIVDRVIEKERPHAVIVATHSGTGRGDGEVLEGQGLDLYQSLRGVDFVVCAHDHRPVVFANDSIGFINAGSRCSHLGHGVLSLEVKDGEVVARSLDTELIPLDKNRINYNMKEEFSVDFENVRAFSTREVGTLEMDLVTRESFRGMCDYINLIHYVQLMGSTADISFAAPLTFNGFIPSGKLIYQDMFTIYPYENQLVVAELKGSEIKNYLELSYDIWIQTPGGADPHVLRISPRKDDRNNLRGWSFDYPSFNFDSAAGINYTVDVTKTAGNRVNITTLADGRTFCADSTYKVALTNYRASATGQIGSVKLENGTMQERIVERNKEIRDIVYELIKETSNLGPELISSPELLGSWKFVPENVAEPLLDKDMGLIFPDKR